jgi:hypothetical protein
MKKQTAVYFVKNNHVLLAQHQRVLGIGKWFPYGGNFEPEDNNDPIACTIRECLKEGGIHCNRTYLHPRTLITFYRGNEGQPHRRVLFYIGTNMHSTPKDSEEMKNATWFPILHLPYGNIKEGDMLFINLILRGQIFTGHIRFADDAEDRVLDYFFSECTVTDLVI